MLSIINKRYLLFGIIILLFFIPYLNGEFDAIYVVNIVTFFTFYLTISKSYYKPESFFTKQRLGYIVFSYLLFFVVVYNSISFYYQGNFWVFSEADAAIYDEGAIKMAAKSFVESIYYALDYWNTDDLGMFLVLSTLYRVVESNLFLNLFYILVGVVTSFSIFRISKNFTSRKYSFLCALTYSISSFVIWFHSSGLKESFLIMLIVSFYDYYYMYLKRRKSSDALCFIISLVAILFFRPVILIFCISSVGFMMLLSLKKGWSTIFIIILAVIVSISMFSYIRLTAENYLRSGDIDQLIQSRDAAGMVSGSVSFTYSVNILASAIGPLPTILPNVKQMLSLFSVGLIYRVFLSVAFWLGLYYSIKEKIVFLYPLLLFVFMEVIALTILMESLELRKSLPHFPYIFIVSFWFLDYYDKEKVKSKRQRARIKYILNASSVLFFLIIMYWNFK